ncbi:MAG: CoA transferase, partial [Dehalococcoidia bacterium]
KHEVMKLIGGAGIPCGACLNAEDIHNDPHLLEREMIVEIDHPQRGRFSLPGSPIKLAHSPTKLTTSPLLGQHTEEVLDELLGINGDEISKLKEAQVI